MTFIDKAAVGIRTPLMEVRFPFDRADELVKAMTWCATDYYTKAAIGSRFEARGIVVIGESRQGKSTEIDKMLKQFNNGSTVMADGRPAKIVSCLLSGKVTWKDLGTEILQVLGYPITGHHRQSDIWSKVRKYAELQGVVGIHFDECQHVFTEGKSLTNQKILDSFKSLLKDQQWPLMLIFSGVPGLATHISSEEQLARLLRTVTFDGINLSKRADEDELVQLVFSYADRAGLEFDDFEMDDFMKRLTFAACQRWGLVIELLIEAFTLALRRGDAVSKIEHFTEAFATISGAPMGYSPFTMPNYEENFDQGALIHMYEKTRQKKGAKTK